MCQHICATGDVWTCGMSSDYCLLGVGSDCIYHRNKEFFNNLNPTLKKTAVTYNLICKAGLREIEQKIVEKQLNVFRMI